MWRASVGGADGLIGTTDMLASAHPYSATTQLTELGATIATRARDGLMSRSALAASRDAAWSCAQVIESTPASVSHISAAPSRPSRAARVRACPTVSAGK